MKRKQLIIGVLGSLGTAFTYCVVWKTFGEMIANAVLIFTLLFAYAMSS